MAHEEKGPRAAPTAYAGTGKIINPNAMKPASPGQPAKCETGSQRARLSDADSRFERLLCAARRRWELRGDPERAARFARLTALLRLRRGATR